MSVDSILARARTQFVGVMSTTVSVKRKSGAAGSFDMTTQTYTPSSSAVVYSGGVLFRAMPGSQRGEDGSIVTNTYEVRFPAGTDIARGDAVTVTASSFDPGLVGLTVWVLDAALDEWSVTRTAMCTDQVQEVPS